MRSAMLGAIVGATLAVSGQAHAGGCESAAQVTSDLWKKYGETLQEVAKEKGGTAEAAANAAAAADRMIQKWNAMAAGWSKLGPRELSFKEANGGAVESVGDRAWVSAHPAAGAVNVSFKKTDGNGKAQVTVCKVDKSNKHTVVKSFEIDKDDKDGKSWDVSIPDAKDHYIVVIVDGKSVTKKVAYSFTAK